MIRRSPATMIMTDPIQLTDAAKHYEELPHQVDAWDWLQDQLTPSQLHWFGVLYRSAPAPAPAGTIIQDVPYFYQLDNRSGQGERECFSSSCAMLAAHFGKVKTDDEYNTRRRGYGPTTDARAQVMTLQSYGLKPTYAQNWTAEMVKAEVKAGRPVAVGWLHHGPATAPRGGGHWSVIVGYDDEAQQWIHNDPNGEADLVAGAYVSNDIRRGVYVRYSYKNFDPRWTVAKPADGWVMACSG